MERRYCLSVELNHENSAQPSSESDIIETGKWVKRHRVEWLEQTATVWCGEYPTTLRIYIHRDSNSRQQSSFCHDFTKY